MCRSGAAAVVAGVWSGRGRRPGIGAYGQGLEATVRFEAIRPSNVHETKGYSQAVRIGNTLYVSGQVPKDRSDRIVGVGDFEAQARQGDAPPRALLEAAGGGPDAGV